MSSDLYQNTEQEESGEKLGVRTSRFPWTDIGVLFLKGPALAIMDTQNLDSILVWGKTLSGNLSLEKSPIFPLV